EDAGPNNIWMDPAQAREMLTKITDGCMRGRTMYVLPYMMGHPDSPYARACVQITDNSYVAISMRIMTRFGKVVLDRIGSSADFVRGIHSVCQLSLEDRWITHFPDEYLVWSVNSGYGGNALLGKKCFSLRIASYMGRQQGWLAEHMLIIEVEDPDGNRHYIAAALPSACGKTNLAFLEPTLPGWKVRTVGDDIAWINIGPDGRLYAINPETGVFGVAPGTSYSTNPNIMRALKAGRFYPTLFTNVALDVRRNVPWWEGIDDPRPDELLDWQGRPWTPERHESETAAHPNSRFTVSLFQAPTDSDQFDNPAGVPLTAIVFGVRRTTVVPLVWQAFDWQHGVFTASGLGSERTTAALGKAGEVRRDPMAMLPFCGYNMADYFRHWLEIGSRLPSPPPIFFINWFRRDANGNFLWPGFGENIRVLKWMIDRATGKATGRETPIGVMPAQGELDVDGLNMSQEQLEQALSVDRDAWLAELDAVEQEYSKYGARLPAELREQLHSQRRRLGG
ncbi:MAG: phosphoenolpyruvate carboxykinase (GTP), partial [Armatimonadetes bacterium]|nr:phosphoenolpyruvate carboxykinase (GTP) [Armatimonadota bacterium]